ncbi:DEAD/DEAH box helicase [Deferribacter autotrophicus]|uniref:DEAD/DEAH box helicase n=1 Tax=Deferribacter autotrophicus TaxID=500465 RepID=A0A5A8F1N1_9BACT|nr:DEAD/DEAH box helicase family protein [Deferribacter autotrophicus]KAA0257302.1 DEAD/DEAH box helicase [Deferribacter autotrophicus]
MTIILPKLEKIYWKKNGIKNIVSQLIISEKEVDYSFVSSHRAFTIIEANETQYCLVRNENNIPEGYDYVIKTNQKATEERLISGSIELIKWLKHPLDKKYSTDEIVRSWNNNFYFIEENLKEGINGLRDPQIAALYSILSHFKVSNDIGTVVMPTGTGKTEVMLASLVARKINKLLVVVPFDALREQTFKKFYSLGLLKQFKLLSNNSLFPRVGLWKQNFADIDELKDFIDNCNVVVTTMAILSKNTLETLQMLSKDFEYVFFDEAHHIESNLWKKVRDSFKREQILQFTATPFRNDRKKLEGKIIFNFPLKKAQEQGYFKQIKFIPVREYDLIKGDRLIAEKAVEQLRYDLENGYNHILMARCENKKRAEEIFQIYHKNYSDLNPVLIHSSIPGKKEITESIIHGKHKIIVAVNMLGEGFDLPQLKIAAFHDIRKSLPVTLQFAGRFTRTSIDKQLGTATFIANLADSNVEDELSELYAQDSDWNLLLSTLSSGKIDEQIDFDEFIRGFQHIDDSKIPFQNIRFALSTVVYKNHTSTFNLKRFKEGINHYDDLEYKFFDYNPASKTLVFISAERNEIEWVNYKDIYGLNWKLMVLYYDTTNNLLFIHSSDKSSLYKNIAKAVLGNGFELISGLNTYRVYSDIKRISLQNVGLKEFLNRKIRFRMMVGTDIEEALSIAEQQRGQKAFTFGSGYEDGNKITLGCSYKGRIWSYLRGNLKEFISWCDNLGKKLIDESINPNQILKETLIPKIVNEIPKKYPTHIDWNESIYFEHKIFILINDNEFYLSDCSLNLVNPSDNGEINFEIETPLIKVQFKKELFLNRDAETENQFADYKISKISSDSVIIKIGSREIDIVDYFNENPPQVWFADGSSLTGFEYVELKQTIIPYPNERLISWNWKGVDLSKESQGIDPIQTDSIQYKVIQHLKQSNFDIIYDDDGSGEIADVIAIKENDKEIKVQFYHIKYAKGGTISTRIDNFYEVCGQAQKSVNWKHKKGLEFFEHLLRRKTKVKQGFEKSRIEKGTEEDLERLMLIAKNKKTMEFEIFIVQPGLSKQNTSENIMTLLGVTENYLKEVGGIDLKVIVNE